MGDALHAHLTLDPPGSCPASELSRRTRLSHFVVGTPGERPSQAVFFTPDEDDEIPAAFDVVVRSETLTIATLSSDPPLGGSDDTPLCDRAPGCCVAWWFRFLPAEPYAVVWDDGRLHLYVAAESYGDLTEFLEVARQRDFTVQISQVSGSDIDAPSPAHVVWLDGLTARQIEVMSVAVEMGYFERDGASADEVADRLGIAKSTLSEHLRVANVKILSHLF